MLEPYFCHLFESRSRAHVCGKECTFTHWMLKGNAEASFFVILKQLHRLRKIFIMSVRHIPVSILVFGYALFS